MLHRSSDNHSSILPWALLKRNAAAMGLINADYAAIKEKFPPLRLVESAWRLTDLEETFTSRSVQALATPCGQHYVLKKIRNKALRELPVSRDEAFDWIDERYHLGRRLSENENASPLAAPLPRQDEPHRYILKWKEWGYSLAPYIEGRCPNYRRKTDARMVLAALARLHLAGRSFMAELSGQDAAAPSLKSRFERELERHRSLVHEIYTARNHSNYPWFPLYKLEQVENNITLAETIFAQAESEPSETALIHGDSHAHNYLIGDPPQTNGKKPASQCFLLDLESMRVGHRVEDLLTPISYYAFHHRFSLDRVRALITFYSERAPLNNYEQHYLIAMLVLPRYWRRMIQSLAKGRHGRLHPTRLRRYISAWRNLPAQGDLAAAFLSRSSL